MSDPRDHGEVGYGRPPRSTRFTKGTSGNPKGRPRGSKRLPHDTVLGQMVTIREEGTTRRVTAAEAFLLHETNRGLQGDSQAARSAMAAIAEARSQRGMDDDRVRSIIFILVAPGSVAPSLRALRMATKLDPYRPTTRTLLEPWLVEASLARLGDRQLSPEEQAQVVRATRTPKKVRWPQWWTVLPS